MALVVWDSRHISFLVLPQANVSLRREIRCRHESINTILGGYMMQDANQGYIIIISHFYPSHIERELQQSVGPSFLMLHFTATHILNPRLDLILLSYARYQISQMIVSLFQQKQKVVVMSCRRKITFTNKLLQNLNLSTREDLLAYSSYVFSKD